jgi:hypothetical protein
MKKKYTDQSKKDIAQIAMDWAEFLLEEYFFDQQNIIKADNLKETAGPTDNEDTE